MNVKSTALFALCFSVFFTFFILQLRVLGYKRTTSLAFHYALNCRFVSQL